MADLPRFRSPIQGPATELPGVVISDASDLLKFRSWDDRFDVGLGGSRHVGDWLVLSVAPGEWIVLGGEPTGETVDITHVRAALRVTGERARAVLEHVCALDLSDVMTPDGAAARTLVAGVATELVRDDRNGEPSYLLLVSRSFAESVHERLVEAASG